MTPGGAAPTAPRVAASSPSGGVGRAAPRPHSRPCRSPRRPAAPPVITCIWLVGLVMMQRIVAAAGQRPEPSVPIGTQTQVVGGGAAQPGRIRYQLGLKVVNTLCGAALIRPDVAVTAAHCLYPKIPSPRSISVVAGAYNKYYNGYRGGGRLYRAKSAVMHRDYDYYTDRNDVALIFLSQCVPMTATVQPIKIATSEEFADAAASSYVISGWGTTSTNAKSNGQDGDPAATLQVGFVKYVPPAECTLGWPIYPESMICAGTVPAMDNGTVPIQDACQGDSGGPLMFNAGNPADPINGDPALDRLAGVVSWGIGCGQSNKPGVYAHLPNLMPWIQTQLDAVKPPCVPAATLDLTFVQESDSTNWFAKPYQSLRQSATVANRTADCEARCRRYSLGCTAFSVSVRFELIGATRNVTYTFCDVYTGSVPPRLCAIDETDFNCGRQSGGSFRSVWGPKAR